MTKKQARITLILLCTAQFIALLDFSITMIPLPEIQKELSFTPGNLQWVVNAYGVAIAGFLLLAGRIADLFGKKRIFLLGIFLFTIASLAGGFAQSSTVLIVTRAFQGLGAALFSPAALSLVLVAFPTPEERNRALGAWTAVAATGYVAGLLLGGIITDFWGWRWVLWLNVPIGALVLGFSYILPKAQVVTKSSWKDLDFTGALLVVSGVAILVYAFANSENVGLTHPITYGIIGFSFVLLASFVWVELRAKAPLMPIPIFLQRSTGGANIASLLANTALGPCFVVTALFMQLVHGFSATQAGLGLLPMAIVFSLSSAWLGTALIARVGTKAVVLGGLTLFAVGLILLGLSLASYTSWAVSILPGTCIAGVGYGVAFPAWTVAGLADVDSADHGLAGGMLTTTQEVGAAVGLAAGTAVSLAVLTSGGSMAEAYGYAIFMSACIVVIGIITCAAILPNRKTLPKSSMERCAVH